MRNNLEAVRTILLCVAFALGAINGTMNYQQEKDIVHNQNSIENTIDESQNMRIQALENKARNHLGIIQDQNGEYCLCFKKDAPLITCAANLGSCSQCEKSLSEGYSCNIRSY
ncbi:MAG: hypothetical protein MI867_23630 [Pseudomonadales bacterium]|nr:hypothetical protein [Pseudomonadales bacterium]